MDLLTRPATEILAALGRRDVSAVELLDATLARIDALNPRINAVVARDDAAARQAARASDERRAKGLDGLLDGLPMTIKDAYDVAGLVSTAGAPAWRERVPDVDAVPVARLRAAGAVILGKTNVPPWSADWVSDNPHYGRTNNPWNLDFSPGGSSGGAVAALATGMTALELGSDLVASIRWPAHATGVFGLKPSWGLVSMRGHRPPAPGIDIEGDLAVAGPLARSARDLDLMLSVIAGPPALDGPRPLIAPPRHTTPQRLRVAVWASDPFAPVDHAVVAGVRRAASLLAGAGADVDEEARPGFSFAEAFEVYALFAHAIVGSDLPEKVREKLAAEAAAYGPDDISHRALQTRAVRLDAALYRSLKERRAAIRRAWAAFFERFDVVLMPPAPVTAVPHPAGPDQRARRLVVDGVERPWMDMFHWAGPASVANLPAAVAPVILTDAGLPTGVQIVAPEGADRTATAVAGMLEALGCACRRPPVTEAA